MMEIIFLRAMEGCSRVDWFRNNEIREELGIFSTHYRAQEAKCNKLSR